MDLVRIDGPAGSHLVQAPSVDLLGELGRSHAFVSVLGQDQVHRVLERQATKTVGLRLAQRFRAGVRYEAPPFSRA